MAEEKQITIKDREWYQRFHDVKTTGSSVNNASFKKVGFIIDNADSKFGRRTVEHQYPLQDVPYSEDLGREARVYIIDGILLGDDYLTQRDNLIYVTEEKGPGELLHPYYGALNVVCKKIQILDVRTETRMCTFQATFVETGDKEIFLAIDTGANVSNQFEDTLANNKTIFSRIYGAVELLAGYRDGSRDVYNQSMRAIAKAKKVAGMPAEFVRQVNRGIEDADILVASADALWDTIVDVITFGFIGDFADDDIDRRKSFIGLTELLDFEGQTKKSSVDSDAIVQLVQVASITTMCLISSEIEYISTDEAESYRTTIFDKLNSLLLGTLADQTIQDLRDLRKVVYEDIEDRSVNLPSLVEYTPQITVPALVLSHVLYGTVDYEQDIIDRNNKFYLFGGQNVPITYGIQHPGFVPGGETLKVLLNA